MLDITEKKYNFADQVENYELHKKEYESDESKIKQLKELTDDVFQNYGFIIAILKDINDYNSKEFIVVLEDIADKLKQDLAQGQFCTTLIEIGGGGKELFDAIQKYSVNDVLLEYSGLILGGYYKVNPQMPHDDLFVIDEKPILNLIKYKAIIVIYEQQEKLPADFFKFMDQLLKNNDLSYQIVILSTIFYNKDSSRFYCYLKSVIIQNPEIGQLLFSRLTFMPNISLSDSQFFELANLTDYNLNTIDEIIHNFKSHNCPKEIINLIRKWILSDSYFTLHSKYLDWMLANICVDSNKHAEYVDGFVNIYVDINTKYGKWITKIIYERIFEVLSKNEIDKTIDQVQNGYISGKLGKETYLEINNILISQLWTYRKELNDNLKKCIWKVSLNVLDYIKDKSFLNDSFEGYSGKFSHNKSAGNYEELLKVSKELLNQMMSQKDYDFAILDSNLKSYDVLYSKFIDLIKESYTQKIYSPFFWLLDKLNEQNYPWPKAYLNTLESCTKKIYCDLPKLKQPKIDKIKNFANQEKFWKTFSEFVLINRFEITEIVDIDAKLDNDSDFDLKCNIDKKNYWFELTSPDDPDYFRMGRGARAIGNRTESIISKKITKLSSDMLDKINCGQIEDYFFIVIDITNAVDLNEYNIENTFYGELQYTFVIDKETGKEVDSGLTRGKSKLMYNEKHKKWSAISGLIYFEKKLASKDDSYYIKLVGDIICNPEAKNKLEKNEYIRLKKKLFEE